ncbi:hypothetical protein KPH14_011620 [Odynerus spinipes]|uniref:Uncharacterized protein n=1 Tax=Odynerus spinipes TaxID=1348599 RepID=A0AAD9RF69_9HYME|nr:hypothetical protein KPH14_011620 [Odynerus spinipes]
MAGGINSDGRQRARAVSRRRAVHLKLEAPLQTTPCFAACPPRDGVSLQVLGLRAVHISLVRCDKLASVQPSAAGRREPYARKLGKSYTSVGLGTRTRVSASRSEYPWAAVAICNPAFQMISISQLSTPDCACAEVQAPGFSFYVVSHYFQYSDEIEGHLRHHETVFRSPRRKRLLVALDANA